MKSKLKTIGATLAGTAAALALALYSPREIERKDQVVTPLPMQYPSHEMSALVRREVTVENLLGWPHTRTEYFVRTQVDESPFQRYSETPAEMAILRLEETAWRASNVISCVDRGSCPAYSGLQGFYAHQAEFATRKADLIEKLAR